MVGGDEIIGILAVCASGAFALGTAYFMCRTCFNWKYAAYLFSFLGLTTLIWRFLEEAQRPTGQIFTTTCKKYSSGIYDCAGWLITHKTAYDVAIAAQDWMTSTELASGQALIAGFVVVAIALSQYSTALLRGGIKNLVVVGITVIASYLVFVNISDIHTTINRAFDMTISFGKYDPESSYQKLATYFEIFDKLEVKMSYLSMLSFKESMANNLAVVSGFLFKLLYGVLSWANLVMFLFQTLTLIFVPSMTATAFINFKLVGPRAALQPIILVSGAVIGRIFVIGQIACINQIEITPEFGTIASANWGMVLNFATSYVVAFISLIITMVGMLSFVVKLIFDQFSNPKIQALV